VGSESRVSDVLIGVTRSLVAYFGVLAPLFVHCDGVEMDSCIVGETDVLVSIGIIILLMTNSDLKCILTRSMEAVDVAVCRSEYLGLNMALCVGEIPR
jgi:hypothetical protein